VASNQAQNVIAVDIGNSRMKVGCIARAATVEGQPGGLPVPEVTADFAIEHATGQFDSVGLASWCELHARDAQTWLVASVHRGAADRLSTTVTEWSATARVDSCIRRLMYRDVSLPIHVDEPERVGIDRLLAAFAANRLRDPDRAAIIVDLGTAITVDLVDETGAFCGGAILPGIATSARALAEHTDALPRVAMDQLENPPDVVGKSTIPAIESGLYWGALGAVRELISQMSAPLKAAPDVFLTGGASAKVSELLAMKARYKIRHVPHLVLSGIALVEP
jgi:type III pantothenate kinase